MVLGKGGIQKHGEKVILLPTGASQEAAGKSPSIQPEDDREDPGAHGLDAETNATAMPDATAPVVEFPLCHAAVKNIERDEWVLADAILAECSEPGLNGIRTGSYSKMEKMRAEIIRNHGVELSFERVRKLRKVASAFPAGRRRPGEASLEAHLEAGSPEELDELILKTPNIVLTVSFIREAKSLEQKAQRQREDEERRIQTQEKRDALQDYDDQQRRVATGAVDEHLEQSSTDTDGSAAAKPTPVSPPAPNNEEPSRGGVEALTEELRDWVKSHNGDPEADTVRRAIQTLVAAVASTVAK